MEALLQRPNQGDLSFKKIIENKKSVVIFVRHPG
jgi:hypothetical protein